MLQFQDIILIKSACKNGWFALFLSDILFKYKSFE